MRADEMRDENEFEQELRRAMRPVAAPAGLADAVLRRAAKEDAPKGRVLAWPGKVQLWAGGALAASVLAGTVAVHTVVQERRRARVEEQFDVAMRATDHALGTTETSLSRAGIRLEMDGQ